MSDCVYEHCSEIGPIRIYYREKRLSQGGVQRLMCFDICFDSETKDLINPIRDLVGKWQNIKSENILNIFDFEICEQDEDKMLLLCIECEMPYKYTLEKYHKENACKQDELMSNVYDLISIYKLINNELGGFKISFAHDTNGMMLKKNFMLPFPSLALTPLCFLVPLLLEEDTNPNESIINCLQFINQIESDEWFHPLENLIALVALNKDINDFIKTDKFMGQVVECRSLKSFKIEDLIFQEVISSGTFGVVYKVFDKKNSVTLALKESKKRSIEELQKEVFILSHTNHPNIIKAFGYNEYNQCFSDNVALWECKIKDNDFPHGFMLMEYCEFGNLSDYIKENDPLNMSIVKSIFGQIVSSCQYLLFKKRMVHRDLKPQNILISRLEPLKIKICDFGFSRVFCNNMNTQAGTPLYCDMNILTNGEYGPNTDLYSLGCILYYLRYADTPSHGYDVVGIIKDIRNGVIRISLEDLEETNDKDVQNMIGLLGVLLEPYSEERLSWEDFLNHPFVEDCLRIAEEEF